MCSYLAHSSTISKSKFLLLYDDSHGLGDPEHVLGGSSTLRHRHGQVKHHAAVVLHVR